MKKLIFIIIIISVAMAGAITYERYFIQSEFGPSSLLGVLFFLLVALALTITLRLFGTRFHEVVIQA